VIKFPDAVANGAPTLSTTPGAAALNSITLSDPPELTVDSNGIRLANTGALSAQHLWQGGVEAAGNWRNFYAQGGYYDFEVQRDPLAFKTFTSASTSHTSIVTPSDDSFIGWYAQATWILTGESKGYNPATGAFTPPQPAAPLALDGSGWGAWELAGRYSVLELNDHTNDATSVITNWTGAATRTYTYYNTVRGGDQKIWTAGLNWYPNNSIRFALDYQWIDISRLQTPATVTTTGVPQIPHLGASQTVQAISLRSQISF
jgi:phosphate-selective porin OprO/OprP